MSGRLYTLTFNIIKVTSFPCLKHTHRNRLCCRWSTETAPIWRFNRKSEWFSCLFDTICVCVVVFVCQMDVVSRVGRCWQTDQLSHTANYYHRKLLTPFTSCLAPVDSPFSTSLLVHLHQHNRTHWISRRKDLMGRKQIFWSGWWFGCAQGLNQRTRALQRVLLWIKCICLGLN